jgi:glutamate-5-semialdehyde dehydrogenase
MEVCLVHSDIAKEFLPLLKSRLVDERKNNPVTLIGDKRVCDVIDCTPATEKDFDTEFLDYKMAIATVDSVEEAVDHISLHSTSHSESIITRDAEAEKYFTDNVDSSSVYVNASTRFTDGGEFGLGCEMGISTQKMHARGPLGIEELTTYKYVILGSGQIRK